MSRSCLQESGQYQTSLLTRPSSLLLHRVLSPFFFFFTSFISFLKTEFIGVTLVNKIIQVQVSNSISHHLITILCVHHPKPSLLLSPFTAPLPSSTLLTLGNVPNIDCDVGYTTVFNYVRCISVKKGDKSLFSLWQSLWCLNMRVQFEYTEVSSLVTDFCHFLSPSTACCECSPVHMNNVRGTEDRPSLLPHNGQGNYHLSYQVCIKSLFS